MAGKVAAQSGSEERHNMLQDPNPTDYPELEKFCDWLCENYSYLPQDFESLKKAQVEYSALCAIAEAADYVNDNLAGSLDWMKSEHGKGRVPEFVQKELKVFRSRLNQALTALAKLRS